MKKLKYASALLLALLAGCGDQNAGAGAGIKLKDGSPLNLSGELIGTTRKAGEAGTTVVNRFEFASTKAEAKKEVDEKLTGLGYGGKSAEGPTGLKARYAKEALPTVVATFVEADKGEGKSTLVNIYWNE